MRTIHKYPVPIGRAEAIYLPDGAIVRHFGEQDGKLCIWAEVDPDAPCTRRPVFQVVGTGFPIPESGEYCGTCLSAPYVWHLYQLYRR